MKTWFIEISDKNGLKLTLYTDGSIYGNERGKCLTTLSNDNMKGYYNFNNNPFTIKVNDLKKNNRYKFIGWPETLNIISVLLRNYYQRNLSNCPHLLASFR